MFRERIKDSYDNLSSGYRTVADFLLDEPFEAAFMTASNIAKRLDVDTATVVRFAQRLGYEGYPELLEDVRTIVKAEIQRGLTPAKEAPGDVGFFKRSVEIEHRNLDDLFSALPDETIEQALAAITDARHVLIVGQWAMAPLGEFFAMWLKALGKNAEAVGADVLSAGYAFRNLGAEDTVLTFALTGLGTEMVNTLKVAKSTGARIVVFATQRSQAAARLANVEVVCPGASVGPIPSFASILVAMSALLQTMAARDAKQYNKQAAAFDGMYNKLMDGYKEIK
jgi:DNA-binding MurR/RpiR family transcriptional regulator